MNRRSFLGKALAGVAGLFGLGLVKAEAQNKQGDGFVLEYNGVAIKCTSVTITQFVQYDEPDVFSGTYYGIKCNGVIIGDNDLRNTRGILMDPRRPLVLTNSSRVVIDNKSAIDTTTPRSLMSYIWDSKRRVDISIGFVEKPQ